MTVPHLSFVRLKAGRYDREDAEEVRAAAFMVEPPNGRAADVKESN